MYGPARMMPIFHRRRNPGMRGRNPHPMRPPDRARRACVASNYVDPGCRKARDEAESGLDPLGELLAPRDQHSFNGFQEHHRSTPAFVGRSPPAAVAVTASPLHMCSLPETPKSGRTHCRNSSPPGCPYSAARVGITAPYRSDRRRGRAVGRVLGLPWCGIQRTARPPSVVCAQRGSAGNPSER